MKLFENQKSRKTYCMPTSSETTTVLVIFSGQQIIHQLHDPLNNVIIFHHRLYLWCNFQLHTMFEI